MEMQSLTVKIVSEMLNRGIIQAKEKNIYCSGWTVLVSDFYQEICRWNTCEEKGYLFAVYGMHFMVRTNSVEISSCPFRTAACSCLPGHAGHPMDCTCRK